MIYVVKINDLDGLVELYAEEEESVDVYIILVQPWFLINR